MTNSRFTICLLTMTLACPVFLSAAEPADAAKAPTREFVEISVYPSELNFELARDSRSVVVSGKTKSGLQYDLTASAKIVTTNDVVAIDAQRFVSAVKNGQSELIVKAAGLEKRVPVSVANLKSPPVDFIREVNPALSRVGCNQGTCHGSRMGKNGFKLSLRGYDPLYDYRALVDDISGRRFNRSRPSQSLMLLKPTQGVPHEGGFLFDEKSQYYKLIEQWIAEGCEFKQDSQKPVEVSIYPEKPLLQAADDLQQLIVFAKYADGAVRDVTREAVFETSNFEVATVSKTGQIEAIRRGEAAALVRYEGLYAAAPITIMGNRDGYQWNNSPELNYVDTLVNDKLKRMKILPADLASDDEFLRRLWLDLAGVPPTGKEVRAFLADSRDTKIKRAEKIDELLAGPEFVDHWTLKWSDLLLSNRKYLQESGVWAFRNWIRKSIAENKPYNEFAFELMTATGSTLENPAANYYRIAREPKVLMENMTQVFLGTRFNCNQCHDHPFEKWTQQQYYQLAAYFSGVGRKKGTGGDEIIYDLGKPQLVKHPGSGQLVPAAFPFEMEGQPTADGNVRMQLANWLTQKDNPFFARSIVNRYWSYFVGRGIIDPVDDIRASNPPSNPELLSQLTQDFVDHNFDLKHLIHTIVNSHTYQRSFKTNKWNEGDKINFSHASPRRLSAEQLFDSITVATGAPSNLPGMPAGFRASQLPDPKINLTFLDMFGRAPRESPCECERSSDVSLGQTLNLVNGPTIGNAIIHPQGLIARSLAAKQPPEKLVEEIYISVLCRFPSEQEKQESAAYFKSVGNQKEAAEDLMWALINSPAFLFNR